MADELNQGGDIRIAHAHRESGPADPDTIRHDIDDTRERMSHTIDEIGDRLNPNHIKARVKQDVRDATIGRAETMARHAADRVNETRNGMMDTIRDNPIPAAMVGIGLGWLMWNGKREHSHERSETFRSDWYLGDQDVARGQYEMGTMDRMRGRADRMTGEVRERASHMADEAGEMADRTRNAVGNAVDRTQEAFSDTTDRAQELAVEFADRTRYRAHRVEDRFNDGMSENPLAMGAAAVALGIAAGLSVPSTRTESRLMGNARDQVVDRVRDMAEEAGEKAQNVASRVVDNAEDTVRSATSESRFGTTSGDGSGRTSQSFAASGQTTPASGMGGSANMPGRMGQESTTSRTGGTTGTDTTSR
jgi:uncharacterized protein YjbJ (UPF0337 family)